MFIGFDIYQYSELKPFPTNGMICEIIGNLLTQTSLSLQIELVVGKPDVRGMQCCFINWFLSMPDSHAQKPF